jgi:hypothetical protein
MKDTLLPDDTQGKEEVAGKSRFRKRNNYSDDGSSNCKKEATEKSRPLTVYQKPQPVKTKNFVAPPRAVSMDGAETNDERYLQATVLTKVDHPPPIVLTS